MNQNSPLQITMINARAAADRIAELAELLHHCVHHGASIGFVLPFSTEQAADWWRAAVFAQVASKTKRLFVAEHGGKWIGSVQLALNTPGNQPHRGDVAKLLVDPTMRRRGVARALLNALEQEAIRQHRVLLTLDTRTGDAAELLYRSMGYQTVGVIPAYCIDPHQRGYDSTTVMYKQIAPPSLPAVS